MIRYLFPVATACLLISALIAEESGSSQWAGLRFERPLASVSSEEGLGVVEIDAELFANCREGLPDLRLLRIRGEERIEWPYLLRVRDDRGRHRGAVEFTMRDFEKTAEGDLIYLLERESVSPRVTELRLATPLRNFEKTVSIDIGEDGESWDPLLEEALVYDRRAYFDFRRTTAEFPASDARWFRVRIRDATDEQRSALREVTRKMDSQQGWLVEETLSVRTRPFRVDRFTLLPEDEDEAEPSGRAYPLEFLSVGRNEDNGDTEVLIDTRSIPLDRIELQTSDRNFHRAVRVDVPRDRNQERGDEEWREIGGDSVHRYKLADLSEQDLAIRFREVSADRMRLRIENGDSPEVSIDAVKGFGPNHELVFLSQPGDEWKLLYGDAMGRVDKPDYDTTVIRRAAEEQVPEERLGLATARPNPLHDGGNIPGSPWFAQRWILHVIIALVVALLVWVLVRVARNVERDG